LKLELPASRGVHFEDRARARAEHAADLLVPMLPECARSALLGASEAQAWLPLAQQDALLSQAIRSKSGANGDRLYEAIKTLVFISAFAEAMGLEPDSMWPMPRGSAATLISGEHQRAKKAGVGSRGGATVGDNFRSSLKFLVEHLGFPIEVSGTVVTGAAPSAKAAGGRKSVAATLPPRFYFHLESLAASSEDSIVRFFARSFLLCAWFSIRVQDMERTKFFPDSRDPTLVVRGWVKCS